MTEQGNEKSGGSRERRPRQGWGAKFACALRGIARGAAGQSSFYVHLPAAVAVVVLGALLRVTPAEWGLLLLCITVVLAAELLNSALESLARAVAQEHNEHLAAALDISSGAVLVASAGAAIVGAIVFVYRLGVLLTWWTS